MRLILINLGTEFINTLINVYTAHGGSLSVIVIVTTIITRSLTLISCALYLTYSSRLFTRLKRAFDAKTDMLYRMTVAEV